MTPLCGPSRLRMNRREMLALSTLAGSWGCLRKNDTPAKDQDARLKARPAPPARSLPAGQHVLGLQSDRDGLIYVPAAYRPDAAAPLAVILHGAGNSARGVAFTFRFADEHGVVVLAPDSRDRTWDIVFGEFGPDVHFIDAALHYVFTVCAIDPARLAIGGFSDGASSALSLGMANGDLFTHLIAFSPGFIVPAERHGHPRVFVSHGRRDQVLPIDSTSRRIVPHLQAEGYEVRYREFDGPHAVPDWIGHDAFRWLAGR
jgi:phospholipase/carboxylesterase